MKIIKSITTIFDPNTKNYWDELYESEISKGKVRQDENTLKILHLLRDREMILDFGSGPGGNVKLLAEHLNNKHFYLVDHSEKALEFAKNNYLRDEDSNGNKFHYSTDINQLNDYKFDAIYSIQVMEHIKHYGVILDVLWHRLKDNGILIISVPVKGWRDRHREHVNKFTIKSMFEILNKYSEWIHIAPRTYSRRSGILATAFFYIYKNHF